MAVDWRCYDSFPGLKMSQSHEVHAQQTVRTKHAQHVVLVVCRSSEICKEMMVLQKVAAFMHTSMNTFEIFRVSKFDIGLHCPKFLSKSAHAYPRAGRSNLRCLFWPTLYNLFLFHMHVNTLGRLHHPP